MLLEDFELLKFLPNHLNLICGFKVVEHSIVQGNNFMQDFLCRSVITELEQDKCAAAKNEVSQSLLF